MLVPDTVRNFIPEYDNVNIVIVIIIAMMNMNTLSVIFFIIFFIKKDSVGYKPTTIFALSNLFRI